MSIQVSIKKDFGSFVLDVNFEAENAVLALLGASGCGKSMTLKCIAGVVRPDEGRIVVNGVTFFDSKERIHLSPQKRRIGLLFQNYALFPNRTVEQNILPVLSLGNRKGNIGERFRALIRQFHIEGLENHYPAQLSGGQQQRVALARIMASDPTILMLDEPLSALDSYLRWQLEEELARMLTEFEGTTLYVSHNRDEVFRLCQNVCVMNGGRTERVRSLPELFESPDTLAAALLSGCKNYSRAERMDEHTVRALDWNRDFKCAAKLAENIAYIGVRSHHIRLCTEGDKEGNYLSCKVLRITQDVFSTIVSVLPEKATPTRKFSCLRVEVPKPIGDTLRAGDSVTIQIKPDDILPLKSS